MNLNIYIFLKILYDKNLNKNQSSPTLKRQCFSLISLIPNPTSVAYEFYVFNVLYKYLSTYL